MGFEVFKPSRPNESRRGVPSVRVPPGGQLLQFNAAALELLSDARYLLVLVDRASNRVAFQRAERDDPNAYKVTRSSSQASLSGARFVREQGLPAGTRLDLRRDGELLVADLPPRDVTATRDA